MTQGERDRDGDREREREREREGGGGERVNEQASERVPCSLRHGFCLQVSVILCTPQPHCNSQEPRLTTHNKHPEP